MLKVNIDKNWSKPKEKGLDAGVLEMITDAHRRAVIIAPKDTRALANDGKIKKIPDGYSLTFGSSRVPYARKRHFENKKNPGSIRYLEKAGESVARGSQAKYFGGKV